MAHYDVFNGDADGLCALQQLRLANPKSSQRVTGPKRDIALLERVNAKAGDSVTVLDISMAQNYAALQRLLAVGANVAYFDHHHAGDVPAHPNLRLFLDLSPTVCTSLLVDRFLCGASARWAIVGAFGDGLFAEAMCYCNALNLTRAEQCALQELGECLNYNSYGDTEDDLCFAPSALHGLMRSFPDPLSFISENRETVETLKTAYSHDIARAKSLQPVTGKHGLVFTLPDAAWSRRVSGMLASYASQKNPDQAIVVIRAKGSHSYVVSVRASRSAKRGADQLCREFPTGGGRFAAAGINDLPEVRLGEFLSRFDSWFSS